jgi:bifunctional DNA-binding transcriptional regulator/antitoxin component of YhaV-PrlF toxin-antitoxin module
MPLTMTSKRQVTFPKAVCDELKLEPGDEIALERRLVEGETVWVLRPKNVDWSWIGAAKPTRAKAKASHDMDSIRASIAIGRSKGARR